MALEMARRLPEEGETVAAVILVAPRPRIHRWLTPRRFQRVARACWIGPELEAVLFGRLTDVVLRGEGVWPADAARAVAWLHRPAWEKLATVGRKMTEGSDL